MHQVWLILVEPFWGMGFYRNVGGEPPTFHFYTDSIRLFRAISTIRFTVSDEFLQRVNVFLVLFNLTFVWKVRVVIIRVIFHFPRVWGRLALSIYFNSWYSSKGMWDMYIILIGRRSQVFFKNCQTRCPSLLRFPVSN